MRIYMYTQNFDRVLYGFYMGHIFTAFGPYMALKKLVRAYSPSTFTEERYYRPGTMKLSIAYNNLIHKDNLKLLALHTFYFFYFFYFFREVFFKRVRT